MDAGICRVGAIRAAKVIPPIPRACLSLSREQALSFARFPETCVLIAPRRGFHIGTLLAVCCRVCYIHTMSSHHEEWMSTHGRLAGNKWLNLLYKRIYGTI